MIDLLFNFKRFEFFEKLYFNILDLVMCFSSPLYEYTNSPKSPDKNLRYQHLPPQIRYPFASCNKKITRLTRTDKRKSHTNDNCQ